jgi:transcriptional regulator with XRE-family HTH domain
MASKKRIKEKTTHYKHVAFQKALGDHCRKLRKQKGYSVNRLAGEAERMSPDVVMRLESGGIVTTTTLYRFAEVLGVSVRALFDFPFSDES